MSARRVAATPYALLDSGGGRKLEQVGPWLVDRQAPQALWSPRLEKERWQEAAAVHHRSERGGGHWELRADIPGEWNVRIGGLDVLVRPTPFGHLGLFAEQEPQWGWMAERIASARDDGPPQVLNLFAYTGIASLTCARAGAAVCHVDAARGIVEWAQVNARMNGLEDHSIRWIVDDVLAFCAREVRRGRRYRGILLDPPSFGRGARKETWKIEEHLPALLALCARLLDDDPLFLLLSAHTPGFGSTVLENLVQEALPSGRWQTEGREMLILDSTGRTLPSGTCLRCVPRP